MDNPLFEKLEDMGAEVEDTLERLSGDEELYLEYLRKLPENQNIIALRAAVEAKDSEQAQREVHTLKGVALNLGLLPLVDACMDMLLALRAGQAEEGYQYLPQIEEAFEEWKTVIQES